MEIKRSEKMNNGKIVIGAILLVITIWVFITMSDTTARYLGGAILGILGLASLITGLKEK
jgi:hypothetical protein